MFESVTKKRKNPLINIFGWTLLGLVCVVFVFIGFSPNSSFLGSGGAAAEVNGDAISLREYKELLDRLDNNGQGAGDDRESRIKSQENAVNILVSRALIVQKAEDLNIFVSDAEVAKSLLDIEPFYEDGQFSRLRYKTYLQQARLTESEFENKIRKDLIIQKMSNLVGFAAKDVPLMDDFDDKIDKAQINVGYVHLTPSLIRSQNKQSLADYASAHEKEIETYYKNHKSEFVTKEQVKARHILIKADQKDPAGFDTALAQIEAIAKKLTVENFSELAKKHSDDPGSKTKGGDLGLFPRGRMVPEFEDAAFSLPVGTISEPVKTQYGYHILLVDSKKGAAEKSLDEVKLKVAEKLRSEEGYNQVLEEAKNHLKANQYGELETLIAENNLKWKDTGFFSITKDTVPGVGENKEFLDVAMTTNEDNEYADQLVYKGDGAYLIKFKGARMDQAAASNGQMDFFKKLMKQQKMNMIVQEWTSELQEEASIKINQDIVTR